MRYFLEVSYKGTAYSGFQEQKNANTVQADVENFASLESELKGEYYINRFRAMLK